MNDARALDLYRHMLTARIIDKHEQMLVSRNLAHFHVSGAGHESTAALAAHLTPDDWLHLHYRDKALLLARGLPLSEFFASLLCRACSHSAGRQMSAHFSAPHLHLLSQVGPVGNNALQAVGVAAAIKDRKESSIVVCSVGDGTTQQGEFYEAVAEAVRNPSPILFLIENNRFSISTRTEMQTFFDLPGGMGKELFGIPIEFVEGRYALQADVELENITKRVRTSRSAAVVVFHVERLADHTNADDQSRYRNHDDIVAGFDRADPVRLLKKHLLETRVPADTLQAMEAEIEQEVSRCVERMLNAPLPVTITTAKRELPRLFSERTEVTGTQIGPQVTMRDGLRLVLQARLSECPDVFLYGEDIEDPKGDVFGVTQGLSTAFPGRVVNSPLSESTIVGTCIGRALAGQRPVAFIQFADFLPLAFNQILSELASMYWRTNGGWECPVIVMVSCGGYKPGLGPFHSQTLEAVMAHTPGLDVAMPSSAGDAVGLLNAAFESRRPTIFFYPKACLNLPDRSTSLDVTAHFVPLGKAKRLRNGNDLTLVTWGSCVTPSLQAVDALESAGFTIDLFDLRTVSPWDAPSVLESAERTTRLIVVHEDNLTAGFGAEVIAQVIEHARCAIRCRRIARPDAFVPCNFRNQMEVLPDFRRIVSACADLLNHDVEWIRPPEPVAGLVDLVATGSGPSDETVIVLELHVQLGDKISVGQTIADLEASKSVVSQASTLAGTVAAVCVTAGQTVRVGEPLVRLQCAPGATALPPPLVELPGHPRFTRRSLPPSLNRNTHVQEFSTMARSTVYALRPSAVPGGREVSSARLAETLPGWTAEEIVKRTGVESRYWVSDGEHVVSLAIQATQQLLSRLGPETPPITAVLCSTTIPREASPSVACQVATSLREHPRLAPHHFALDFNAACSGYLYGLRLAHSLLQTEPDGAVLLLTSEVASPMLNPQDPTTIFLFGDAATATLVTARPLPGRSLAIQAPYCAASADSEGAIHLPCAGTSQYIRMEGMAVARAANKGLTQAVRQAMQSAGIDQRDLAALVPHAASKRILQNVAQALDLPASKVFTTLADTGNTSSSSVPVALDRFWDDLPVRQPIALAAFGAGFTSAATLSQLEDHVP